MNMQDANDIAKHNGINALRKLIDHAENWTAPHLDGHADEPNVPHPLPSTTPRPILPHPHDKNGSSGTKQRITVPDRYALMRLVQLIANARERERNNLTYWAACRAGEMVASGLLAADAAVAVIAEAAARAGLPRAEAERTAWSGIHTTGGFVRA
jgi:hypothetical protein